MNKEAAFIKKTFLIFLIGFIFLSLGSLVWNIINEKQSVKEYATIEAQASFNKDILYRQWNAMHGGVYVPITDKTPSNPYLTFVPEKDITTVSGKKLTLINPAYMTRQVYEIAKSQNGMIGHITSLNPIRPENKADEWETIALQRFEKGENNFNSIEKINGATYLRFMNSMKVEESCMKCHSHQGYKLGDNRGGISVAVSLEKYQHITSSKIKALIITHLIFFLIILIFFVFVYRRFIKEIKKQSELQSKIAENESFLTHQFNKMPIAYILWDTDWRVQKWNPAAEKLFGYTEKEVLGKNAFEVIVPEQAKNGIKETLKKKQSEGTDFKNINENHTKKGEILQCVWYNSFLKNDQGAISQIISMVEDITERKQSEQNLIAAKERAEESETKVRSMFQNALTGFVYFTPEGKIIEANPAVAHIMGSPSLDATLSINLLTFEPLIKIGFTDSIKQCIKGKSVVTEQKVYTTKWGKTVFLKYFLVPIFKEDEVIGIWANLNDLTDLWETQNSLKNAIEHSERIKKRLQDAQALAKVGNWEIDLKTGTIWESDEALRIYGLEATDQTLLLKKIQEAPLPEYRYVMDESLTLLVTESTPYNVEFQIKRQSDGLNYYVHSKAELEKDENGQPSKVIGVIQDITDRKLIENELRVLSSAIEQNPASIVITNPEGIIEYVNPKFTEVTGYTFNEVKGENPNILKSGLTPATDYAELWKTIKAGYSWNGEFCNKKKNGEFYWESATLSPVYDSLGTIIHFVAVKENITEKKEMERKLYTALIEGEERERNRFSKELHDGLGPLLSTIKLYFQWLAETEASDKKQMIIDKGTNNIDEAIQTLREISNNLSPRSLSIFGLTNTLISFIDGINQIQRVNIQFKSNLKKGFNTSLEISLYRIILELINNSLKHSKANEILIQLMFDETTRRINLDYADDGIGFNVKEVQQNEKGNGLPNIQNRVLSFNGYFGITSHKNRGMQVKIEIPIKHQNS
ncbi:MAG: hypothetical protein A2W95_01960 [Bacteroidetes bacterium GWA2_40_14]|jgi:PAS domain S-box-containing protein|nr:MAG: hypothetical protein A2W95_01960 [Bacteroidetes bacterium GWA2_40_14]HAZ00991.1 hypothetical protein [Marinilabiliales bacterium]HBO74707.1 hypothetical protein [Marinilabiliales bacterium]